MLTITYHLIPSSLQSFIRSSRSNFLSKKAIKKLRWLFAFFLSMAVVAIFLLPAGGEHWTFGKGVRPVAIDAFDIGAESWDRLAAPVSEVSPITPLKVSKMYGKLPLSFEVNEGQTDSPVKFLSRGPGYGLFLTSNEAVLTLRKPKNAETQILQLDLSGVKNHRPVSVDQAQMVPEEPPVTVHLKLIGANPNSGTTKIPVILRDKC